MFVAIALVGLNLLTLIHLFLRIMFTKVTLRSPRNNRIRTTSVICVGALVRRIFAVRSGLESRDIRVRTTSISTVGTILFINWFHTTGVVCCCPGTETRKWTTTILCSCTSTCNYNNNYNK